MLSFNHRHNTVLKAGIAGAALGLCMLSTPGYAQNDVSASPAAAEGADADLAARVKQALHSDKALNDRHVKVAVEHGQVVLNGFVQDSRELTAAGQVASKAAGTHKIVNNLTVNQNPPNAP